MVKLIFLLFCFLSFLAPVSFAQEVANNNVTNATNNEPTSQVTLDVENKSGIDNTQNLNSSNRNGTNVIEKTPEVGKHVNSSMNVGSMIMSLLMVLALIIVSAFILKRFNLTQHSSNHLKIVANLSLGAKERIIIVQIGEQQLVLGVCPQQISLLKDLEEPIDVQVTKPLALSKNVLSFLHKSTVKTDQDSNIAKNETTNNK